MKTKDAVEAAGGVRQLAELLGIWPQSVYEWGEDVPPLRAYQLRDMLPALAADADDKS